jgi:hypothetical protein
VKNKSKFAERCPTNAQGGFKAVVIVPNRSPWHVSVSKCHLQGVTISFHKLLLLSAFQVGMGYCPIGAAIRCGMCPSLYRGLGSCGVADNRSSLWKDIVTPWRWYLEAETCRGELPSTIKNCFKTASAFFGHLSPDYKKCLVQLLKKNICSCAYPPGHKYVWESGGWLQR